ncbi:hypothetical protein GLOIN_2v1842697 [Rhizophagus irregularis DAOM 181602=DAOM 197198]|uniref:Uncharacterized protein n=1 Tax=Rhizophagus irregularis (strain DAOM 197198w) TaxID=1432141 RepID=A0A015KC08_RHIIW|nr:hypothetical protein RirG_027170 [Rhizophagus irregularis DAOM 197198w]GET66950.1 hypothetical protein GLOIN_2v1842697 [Rhizophagus irregularis DAOM 181602=DAOM 197198]
MTFEIFLRRPFNTCLNFCTVFGVIVAQEEATSQTLEHDINKHYEEESEDWWEVYRSYKYETTDNLGDLFRVEAQVINKQHAELHDLQKAGI